MKLKAEQIRKCASRECQSCDRLFNGIKDEEECRADLLIKVADHITQIESDLDKAEKRVKLLEGAIERQNNTISYLSSTNGQGFNW